MTDEPTIEDRLRRALRAQGERVRPDDGAGLDRIRHRGARARSRRRAALAGLGMAIVLAAAVAIVPRIGDGDPSRLDVVSEGTDPTTPDEPTPEPAPPTSTEPGEHEVTPTFVPVIWPPAGVEVVNRPVDVVRSFVEDYVGIADPPLSAFRETGPLAGEVDVHRRAEDGAVLPAVASVVSVRAVDGAHWAVTGAASESVVVETPAPLAGIVSPVTVEGRGRGFEGTIVVTLRQAGMGARESMAVEPAIGGCCEALEPFAATLSFAPPTGIAGSLLLSTDSGLDGAVVDFSALAVSFPSFTMPVPTAQVWFLDAGGRAVAVERPAPGAPGVLRSALESLLAGPTDEERAAGIQSVLGEGSAGLLDDVTITDGFAVVDLDERLRDTTTGLASASSEALIGQLNRTVFQFATVLRVEYRLGGSCDAFGMWAHDRVCDTYDRSDVPG